MRKSSVLVPTALTGMFAAICTLVAVTDRAQRLGPDAKTPELQGITTTAYVFTGGPAQDMTVIEASALEAGKSYKAEGGLVINGDVPDRVSLTLINGELTINGDVGAGCFLKVSQPLAMHIEGGMGYTYEYGPSITRPGDFSFHGGLRNKSETVIDGLRYDDPDPAIRITGRVGADTRYDTPGRVVVNGHRIRERMPVAPRP